MAKRARAQFLDRLSDAKRPYNMSTLNVFLIKQLRIFPT